MRMRRPFSFSVLIVRRVGSRYVCSTGISWTCEQFLCLREGVFVVRMVVCLRVFACDVYGVDPQVNLSVCVRSSFRVRACMDERECAYVF
jgi:hypothetical protein